MKNKLPTVLVSTFFVLVFSLNACTPQATPVPSSTPDTVSTLIASALTPAVSATPIQPAKPTELSATLSELTGKVEIKQAEQDAFSPASTDSFLNANGQVQTGDDGRARLDISTGTIVRVAPASIFTLVTNEPVEGGLKTRLSLFLGKLYIILNGGSMEVETPTGTAAVRGSFISVNYDPASGEVRITCLEGHCSLTNAGGTVEITAGQTAVITGIGQPPQVGEMSDQDIQDWLNNNPEAKLVVDALKDEQPTQSAPTIIAPPPVIYAPSTTRKPAKEESQPTAGPSLVPIVQIVNLFPAGSVAGETLNIAASVIPSASGPSPTGTVIMTANGNLICTGTLDEEGFASCTGGIAAAGSFNLIASYLGDANYIPAQSTPWANFVVAKANTTTTITSTPLNPSLVNVTAAAFTATVDYVAPGAGTPFGSVTFSDGTDGCTATAAPWTCNIVFTNIGTRTVTATYSGDANFNNSISASVTHEVLGSVDSDFRNISGPISVLLLTGQCNQPYSVDVLDVNGVNEARMEYSVNDNTFASPNSSLLTHTGGYTWQGNFTIPATYPAIVYWRFSAIDGLSNQLFFGGTTPYSPGYTGAPVSSYFFNLDIGLTCP